MQSQIEAIMNAMRAGKYSDALNKCDVLLEENSQNLDALMLKSEIMSIPDPSVGNPSLAIVLLKKALERYPNHSGLHEALDNVYNDGSGDYNLALEEYIEAIKLSPQNASLYFSVAMLYQHPGVNITLEEVLKYLQKAVELNPNDWEVRCQLGLRFWEIGRIEEAKNELERALKLMPASNRQSYGQLSIWIANVKKGESYKDGFFVKGRDGTK